MPFVLVLLVLLLLMLSTLPLAVEVMLPFEYEKVLWVVTAVVGFGKAVELGLVELVIWEESSDRSSLGLVWDDGGRRFFEN